MPYEIELRLPALQSCLHVVAACVGRLCRTSLKQEDPDFQQAVHEACCSAIQQGYGGDDAEQKLELCFYVDEGELMVELIDNGSPRATGNLPPDDLSLCYELADDVRYERLDDRNRLTLSRRTKQQTASSRI